MKLILSPVPLPALVSLGRIAVTATAASWLLASPVSGAPLVRSAAGSSAAAIQAVVDQFRADLGGGLNPNVAGSFANGRREINWDGVPDSFAAPNALPANFFNVNSPRGVVLSTPGTGFEVSADSDNPTATAVEFGHIDASYPNSFAPFSPQRMFTARGSTVTDVNFFVPGGSSPALVSGFGVVFCDVDAANVTSVQFFDLNGASLGTFFAPNVSGSQTFSFLGVSFNAGERIGRVRITSGNQVLAPGNNLSDLVVMDDFIYAEPQQLPVLNLNSGEAFLTIQAAIDDAQTVNNDIIEVRPGTYSELVTVNKAVTLRGAKFGVDARDASRGSGESIVNGAITGGDRTTAFHVTVDNVTIDGFLVEDSTSASQFGAAVVLGPGTSGSKIRNNIVRDNGVGLFLANDSATSQTLIERNLFANNSSFAAIYTDQTVAGATLVNVVIDHNTFTSNAGAAINIAGSGATPQSRLVISNNAFDANGNGVLLLNTTASVIARNDVTDSLGSQIVLGGKVNGVTISDNRIHNGLARGIRIFDALLPGANSNVALSCNSIQNHAGNGFEIATNGYTGALAATGNWWGAAEGPSVGSNPAGPRDQISDPAGQVTFSPFLTDGTDQQAPASGFQCTRSAIVYGVDGFNNLLRFDSAAPRTILSSQPITGLNAGEAVRGIDFRPTTGELFALGSAGRLYVLDPATAAATFVAALTADPTDDSNPFTVLSGGTAGIDFDPVNDVAGTASLRVTTSNDDNLRINITNGRVITDEPVNPALLSLHAVAYTNVDLSTDTGTTAYGYDFVEDQLMSTAAANSGAYTPIGRTGFFSTASASMDIQTIGGRNIVFTVLGRTAGSSLFLMDLVHGLPVPVGDIGSGVFVSRGLAVAPFGSIQFSAISYMVGETEGTAAITVTRIGTEGTVSVRAKATNGTATAPNDFALVDEVLTFGPGETSKTINVPIVNDSIDEPNETINLELSEPTGGASLGRASALLLISGDDEVTPTLSVFPSPETTPGGQLNATATLTGDNAATGTVTFRVFGPDDASCSRAPVYEATVALTPSDVPNSGPFTATRTGSYKFVVSYSGDANNQAVAGTCGDAAGVTVKPATVLANIATRMRVETGDNVLIGGIIVTGTLPKRMLLRAIGPSAGVAGSLGDPYLELYSGPDLVAENNDWREASNQQEIIDTTIAPADERESAILITLNPGQYTAVVSGVNGETGVGVVEAYDLDRTVDSRFGNIATRGRVQTGANVMIGGLIILGDTTQNVLVRAIGPSLPIDGKLADPTLELVDANGDTLATNNNWRENQQAEIEATGIPPTDDLESAILASLPPAPYTAIIRGFEDSTGVGLVEVYALD